MFSDKTLLAKMSTYSICFSSLLGGFAAVLLTYFALYPKTCTLFVF